MMNSLSRAHLSWILRIGFRDGSQLIVRNSRKITSLESQETGVPKKLRSLLEFQIAEEFFIRSVRPRK